ncbi:hypothetical protein ACP0HM_19035 [Escherichia coli]
MLLVSVVAGSVLYDGQLSRSDGIFLPSGCSYGCCSLLTLHVRLNVRGLTA